VKYDYDIITIGLGPAGMAVAAMGEGMGLKVCAIEKHAIGGECMNVGCIPSKALLRMAKARQAFHKLGTLALNDAPKPDPSNTFDLIQERLKYISEKKTMKMFEKVHMVYREGAASFVDPHTVEVGDSRYTAKRIFICAGTQPAVPAFPGIENIDYLTNNNMFELERVPDSLIVLGSGAIACEMAQAFSRLGSKVTMVFRGPRLMWREDQDVTNLLESVFEEESITLLREHRPSKFENRDGRVVLTTDKGEAVEAERVLLALGRSMDFSEMKLEDAGVRTGEKGEIPVNARLQTSQKHIYACGDCNGYAQFSHAAMHQGMVGLMNSMMPWPFGMDYRKYVVPWTVFTEPPVSRVGPRETELKEKGVRYEVVRVNYGDYGAAIAEAVDTGFIKAFVGSTGRILSVYIIGEGSGEMVNEWSLAIQRKLRMTDIMMLQHSFPTMGFLTKRVSETWMMGVMKSERLKNLCRFMFRR